MAYQTLRIPRILKKAAINLADKHNMNYTIDSQDDQDYYITFRGSQNGMLAIIKATQKVEAKSNNKHNVDWYE